jgi:hypothetical protein
VNSILKVYRLLKITEGRHTRQKLKVGENKVIKRGKENGDKNYERSVALGMRHWDRKCARYEQKKIKFKFARGREGGIPRRKDKRNRNFKSKSPRVRSGPITEKEEKRERDASPAVSIATRILQNTEVQVHFIQAELF